MNLTHLLSFESMHYYGVQTQSNAINVFVANSLRAFIEDFYQRIAPAFIVIVSCRRPSPLNFYAAIMQMLYETVDTMIIQLVNYNYTQPRYIDGPHLHNLLLVDSLDAFLDIEVHKYTEQNDANEYYFIFLQQRDSRIPQDRQGILEYCWSHQFIHCNVMTQNAEGKVVIHTYFPYTSSGCGQIEAVKINEFVGGAWQDPEYFPAKLHNFHKCPLSVLMRFIPPFFVVNGTNSSLQLNGLEGQLLQEFAKRLNFSMHFALAANEKLWTEQQLLNMLQERIGHIAIGYIRRRIRHSERLTAVFPHYANMLVGCVMLSAYNLTSFETLKFPFPLKTWLMLLCSFFIVYCLGIFSQQDRRCKTMLFLRVYAATLGLPISMPPTRASMQVLYASWLFFTLLVRAMYSSLIFLLLRQHVYQKLPQTILELLHNGYTTILNQQTLEDLQAVTGMEQLANLRTIVVPTELEQDVLEALDRYVSAHSDHERVYGILSRDTLMYLTERSQKSGYYYMMPQFIMEEQLSIYLPKHSYLVQKFDEMILSIQAVGLMNYWSSQLTNAPYFYSMYKYQDKSLRQTDLWAIYIIGLCLHFCALLVFLGELLAARTASVLKRWLIHSSK